VRKIIMSDVTNLQHNHAASGILGIAGIVLALWSASNYVAAFMRASNAIYDVKLRGELFQGQARRGQP
jgi:membrane protein